MGEITGVTFPVPKEYMSRFFEDGKFPEIVIMVSLQQVHHLMNNNILQAPNRLLGEFRIQPNAVGDCVYNRLCHHFLCDFIFQRDLRTSRTGTNREGDPTQDKIDRLIHQLSFVS